jgi:hypothetical protein
VTASTRTANGAPTILIRAPATAGPAVCATASAPSRRACARCSCVRGTSRGTKDIEAASLTNQTVPNASTTNSNSGNVRTSSSQATGITANTTARVRSVVTITGRRRIRSTSAPTTRPKTRYGSQRAALSPTHLDRAAAERHHHQRLQRQQRHGGTEPRNRLTPPEAPKSRRKIASPPSGMIHKLTQPDDSHHGRVGDRQRPVSPEVIRHLHASSFSVEGGRILAVNATVGVRSVRSVS